MHVEHDAERHRFVAHLDEGDAELVYATPDARTMDLQHTAVPEGARGEGVADALVKTAFDFAREHDRRVIPSCPFVRAWLRRHPKERDVVAGARSA